MTKRYCIEDERTATAEQWAQLYGYIIRRDPHGWLRNDPLAEQIIAAMDSCSPGQQTDMKEGQDDAPAHV